METQENKKNAEIRVNRIISASSDATSKLGLMRLRLFEEMVRKVNSLIAPRFHHCDRMRCPPFCSQIRSHAHIRLSDWAIPMRKTTISKVVSGKSFKKLFMNCWKEDKISFS
jgi:hypothetical protein